MESKLETEEWSGGYWRATVRLYTDGTGRTGTEKAPHNLCNEQLEMPPTIARGS